MALSDRRPGIRPRASLGRRLDVVARAGFPASLTIVLMLLTQAPLDIAEQAALLPAVTLCCVWFWSLFRPRALPPALVFLIGLVMDLLGYLPLGTGTFTLLAAQGLALATRRPLARRGFAWIWLTFAGVAAGASLVLWLLSMLLTLRLLPAYPAIFIGALSIAIFPILAVPFGAAHRTVADPDRA